MIPISSSVTDSATYIFLCWAYTKFSSLFLLIFHFYINFFKYIWVIIPYFQNTTLISIFPRRVNRILRVESLIFSLFTHNTQHFMHSQKLHKQLILIKFLFRQSTFPNISRIQYASLLISMIIRSAGYNRNPPPVSLTVFFWNIKTFFHFSHPSFMQNRMFHRTAYI